MQTSSLLIENLAFERQYQTLFNHINCSVQVGELLQIRGANGSGKSTFLRILAGYIEPSHGNVIWKNQPISQHYDQLHYIGHQNGVKPYLTIYENLQLNCALSNIIRSHSELKNIIKKVGLSHAVDTQAQYLSAGQTRRLALARLLIHSQPIWILDEPTTSLDAQAQELMNELLGDHLKENGIAIIATHQPLSFPGKTLEFGGCNA